MCITYDALQEVTCGLFKNISHCIVIYTTKIAACVCVSVCVCVCVCVFVRVWTKEENYTHKIPLRGAVPLGGAPLKGNCLKPLELCKIRSCVE